MTILHALIFLFSSGVGGGFVNALLVDRGLIYRGSSDSRIQTIIRLGFSETCSSVGLRHWFIGGLYGPASSAEIGGRVDAMHLSFSSSPPRFSPGPSEPEFSLRKSGKRFGRAINKNLANAVKNTTE